jgi:hypothetical protein
VNVKKIFGFVAIAGLLFVAAPTTQQANAASLNGPGMAAAVQGGASEKLTTEVQYRRDHRGYRPHHGMRRHHGWHRPPVVRRHHGWNRPHHYHRRHWR